MRAADVWTPVDPLGEALHLLRMSGVFYCASEFTEPWGLDLPPIEDCLMFHVVTSGRCWLEVDGELHQLEPGDLVLVPHGRGHRLLSEPGARAAGLFDLPRELVSERFEVLRHGGGGPAASVICAAVRFDHPAALQLAGLLPSAIRVPLARSPQADWVQSTLRLMALEARELRPGGETVITRMADILVIQAIRTWLEQDPDARKGWLGALRDERIGPVIARIHREPERPWTVASLAAEAAMSRSAFAARFMELLGEPPLHYATRWRMHVANTLLRENDIRIAELAERLGYVSEAAFSRAFKRHMGVSPGAVRRKAAGEPAAAPDAAGASPAGRRAVEATPS